MTDAPTLVRAQCRVLLKITGTHSVTVYLREPRDRSPGIWFHQGVSRPIPELADPAVARAFDDEMRARHPDAPRPESSVSRSPCGRLHALSAVPSIPRGTSVDRRAKPAHPDDDLVWVGLDFGAGCTDSDTLLQERRTPGFQEALQLLAALARHARDLTELLEDPVTDLPSRFVQKVELAKRLERAHDGGGALVLLLVSPDEFPALSDRVGRAASDEILAEVARRVRSVVRGEDFVSRHGSATLACLMSVDSPEGARRAARKILERLSSGSYGSGKVPLTFSAGGVISEGAGGNPFEWLQRADAALGESRRQRGGPVCFSTLDARPEPRPDQTATFVHRSRQLEEVLSIARRVAGTDATLLIEGESGSGKEVIARAVHAMSARSSRPFVIVDCGAISASLIESELFGHEKGAFTGAEQKKPGRLIEAEGGTVLLDEIGELPLDVQAKLLRFVQEKQVTPVGGSATQSVDVRIVAATNVALSDAVREGRFRADLYHRLNVVPLRIPPLRERIDDILPLASHFLRVCATAHGKPMQRLSAEAEALLCAFRWPGNVRELQNCILRAVLLSDGTELTAQDFSELRENAPATVHPVERDPIEALKVAVARQLDWAASRGAHAPPIGRWVMDDLVLEAHAGAEGVARKGAALLGVPETTFRRRLARVQGQAATGLLARPDGWEEVRDAARRLAACGAPPGINLLELAENVVLEEVARRCPGDTRTGAALVGVTEATWRLRLQNASFEVHASIGAERNDS